MSKPVYGKNAAPSRNAEKMSGGIWALCAAFILFMCWTPFQVGLFNGQSIDFEKPIYVSALLSGLLLLAGMAVLFKSFKLEERRDLVAAASLLLPLTYILSLFVAASHYMAMNLLLIQSMYTAVFIITISLLKNKPVNVVIQNAVLTLAYLIVAFGLLNWLGAGKFAGAMVGWFSNTVRGSIYLDAVMTDSNGLRLTSIFQYANTYAAFLMAFLFVAVFALVRSKKWYGMLIHGFMLVPIILSLLLTLSRGGLVMLPVAFLLLLIMLKPAKQLLWIIHLAIAGIVSLAITNSVTDIGLELNTKFTVSSALKGWAYLILASAVVAAIGWLIQRYAAPRLQSKLNGWESRKGSGLWIPLGSLILVALIAYLLVGTGLRSIMPDNIETRLENINFKQHSVEERFTFYKDAVKVIKDHPVLGAGGGGWAALYEQYQNNPYTSRQVHNFFLQYLIEVGIVGFIVFIGFIGYIFYGYIRTYLKREKSDFENGFLFYIIALSILVHSLLDFNLSYAFMGILIFVGLGGMTAAIEGKPKQAVWRQPGLRLAYMGVLAIGVIALLFVSGNYISSTNAAYKGKNLIGVSTSYEQIKAPLVKALNKRPFHPESAFYLSSIDQQVYNQSKDEQYLTESYNVLTKALKYEPYNKDLLKQLAAYYDLKEQGEQAFAVYQDNAAKYKWDIDWYDALISRALVLADKAIAEKDDAAKQQYITAGIDAYNRITAGIEHLKTLPPEQLQGRPFAVTPTIGLNAGRLLHLSGQEEQASAAVKAGLPDTYADQKNSPTLWDVNWYTALVDRSYELAKQALDQQTAAQDLIVKQTTADDKAAQQTVIDQAVSEKAKNINIGLQAYNQVSTDLKASKQTIPPSLILSDGKLNLLAGSLQTAADVLKSGLGDNYKDAVNREIARWYLAALTKLGSTLDPEVHNKLIAADPAEEAKIAEIVDIQY
ncbi:O-antigen ligase [Paenibacillus sp. NFR01]|uniref:O-antigen ligase family protein n=1 Tax=Paenibacillus sp. NFR01 TaxID=1566279 RepID=UPI0008BE7038|nr:O-antigen ligase family protein [Paenibacillus sp. NFR01]SEU15305.1 O-antigen ligase [Paenibacillus sp. NFR01]